MKEKYAKCLYNVIYLNLNTNIYTNNFKCLIKTILICGLTTHKRTNKNGKIIHPSKTLLKNSNFSSYLFFYLRILKSKTIFT